MNTPLKNKHLVIITHDEIGKALLSAVTKTLGEIPLPTSIIPITHDTDPDSIRAELSRLTQNLHPEIGLLVLTDLYGSTPSNIANSIEHRNTRIITGLNLPMLIRVMNYAHLNLDHLANKALSGGREGVMKCNQRESLAC